MADKQNAAVVDVDKQGRMVLPSRLREKLGVKNGGTLLLRSEDPYRIVIERTVSSDVQERVKNWIKIALSSKEQVQDRRDEKRTDSGKWMSSEYVRRKLGL